MRANNWRYYISNNAGYNLQQLFVRQMETNDAEDKTLTTRYYCVCLICATHDSVLQTVEQCVISDE